MTYIIKGLWYGNICPQEGGIFDVPELKELMEYIARHQVDLEATLAE